MTPSHTRLKQSLQDVSPARTAPRHPGGGAPVRATWLDLDGDVQMAIGRLRDISEYGLTVELPTPPRCGTNLRFQVDRFRLTGTAKVYEVNQIGPKVLADLEFVQGTRWKPTGAAAAELPVPDLPASWVAVAVTAASATAGD